ncbi:MULTISPECIES: hypothetical protein [unclassified Spirosoma]|uniref:hypothetical protein n=1 Tax=unclassified Spirosoma TaxID=2621999 RepID=UPI00095F40B9|nr:MULTISPECIES: hypothetical protein [unclassified Spirosoma]MBN8825121.1 hypothetical protein [Spirosoma sp.]OJW77188.1 MAG: hypothetical protein BGO59_31535 [Spirosoma sp. 48-14]
MDTFTESQRFRQWWIWIVMVAALLITTVPLVTTDAGKEPFAWGGPVITLLVMLLLYVWRLDTRIDDQGIHYQVFPVFTWRTIPWAHITSASIATYGFVGYGIRLGFDGWVYNIAGNKGVRITKKGNTIITIGTQRPDELEAFLASHQSLITT